MGMRQSCGCGLEPWSPHRYGPAVPDADPTHRPTPSTSFHKRALPGALPSPAEQWHKPVFIAFLLAWLFNTSLACLSVRPPAQASWIEAALPLLAVATTLVSLGRYLPRQNILAGAVTIGIIGYTASWLAAKAGILFGSIIYKDVPPLPRPGWVPWWIPCMWIVVVINARGVARLMLRRWREARHYLWLYLGTTCGLIVAFDAALEPFATRPGGYWIWRTWNNSELWTLGGVPLSNYFGWLACSALMVMSTFVWLAHKRPVQLLPDYHPLVIWVMLCGWVTAGNAGGGMWVGFGIALGLSLLAVGFALTNPAPYTLKDTTESGRRSGGWSDQPPRD